MTITTSTSSRHRPDHIARRRSLPAMAGAMAVTLVASATGVVLTSGPADAAASRHDGVVKTSTVLNCDSVYFGYPYYEPGVGTVASVIYDDAVPVRAGDVFYVSVEMTAVGNPFPCLDQSVRPDLTLPAGIDLALSASNPIRCVKWNYLAEPEVATPETALCPSAPQVAESGGTIGLGTAGGGTWTIPTGIGYEVQVPVVAAGPGIANFTFPVQVVDGNANPILWPSSGYVEIVRAPGTPAPTPGSSTVPTAPTTGSNAGSNSGSSAGSSTAGMAVSTEVGRVVRLSRTHGAVPARVTVNTAGSKVKLQVIARLGARSRVVASRMLTATEAGTIKTKVKIGRAWRARMKGKRVRAVLTSRATNPSGGSANAAETFVVKG